VRGLAAAPLADNGLCCGGAGSYFLDQPEIADHLGAEKIAAIERAGVRTVLTSNFGCALHLNAGLRARGLDAEVIHPAVLLRRIVETGSA
jgi:glycolate oxidase iron-sulfur subunit